MSGFEYKGWKAWTNKQEGFIHRTTAEPDVFYIIVQKDAEPIKLRLSNEILTQVPKTSWRDFIVEVMRQVIDAHQENKPWDLSNV